jgi:hypothetical protein
MAVAVAAVLVVTSAACDSNSRNWEITAENKSALPCSIVIIYGEDSSASARVDALEKGRAHVLVSGSVETPIRSVKVVLRKDEEVLKPDVRLTAGKRYAIVVAADGEVTAAVEDK